MTEKEIESQILAWLNYQKGIYAFKINTTGIFDPTRKIFRTIKNPFIAKGSSDILGLIYGYFFAIEVKTPVTIKRFKNSPNEKDLQQIAFLDKVKDSGGFSIVVSNLDDVILFIDEIRALILPNGA